ncbi:hypothetical protein [Hymenobacter sp. BT730]|uniref:hypothetical protein n=1 Tax=Hymenobacter sp. BT730 TaxID=3063332 RepID=UPI0026E113A0|nr:hypothetical protein [Hymenobacter sp. BT730]
MILSLPTMRTVAGAALFAFTLVACGTGNSTGDTNVERGVDKSHDPTEVNPTSSGTSTTGTTQDTTRRLTGKEIYDQAGEAKDRNNDGIAD